VQTIEKFVITDKCQKVKLAGDWHNVF